jgi:hypothetical protein
VPYSYYAPSYGSGYDYYYRRNFGVGSGAWPCVDTTLAWAGVGTAFVGVAALIPGSMVFASGRDHLARARFLRARYGLSLRPQLQGNAAVAHLALTF